MLYPGYHYLGPGNPVNNGEPVNSTDKIAQIHDIEYDKAKYPFEIIHSDRRAIRNFINDFKLSHRFSSIVGAVGLGVKDLFESTILNVQYPEM